MSTAKSKRPSTVEYSPESAKGRSKKRRLSSDDHDDDDDRMATLSKLSKDTRVNGMRTPAFTHQNKPAELFRKDLISNMKLPDSEPLQPEEYLLIQDPWRQDWEKGVQVPVNSVESLHPKIKVVCEKPKTGDFKIPRKVLHAAQDDSYKQGQHELTGMQQLSEQVVRYDLDDLDACWLKMVNEEREEMGEIAIYEWTMERVMEELEKQCHETMETTIQTEEGLGIEYDEDVICDVCRSPESEENNEMVFCDGCDICVHQACYGIQKIPEGSWLCRTCALGIKPTCMLCPKSGGAMKSTRSGTKWSHVSCALWIPEVSIGCVEKMEPVTKISQIPISRWALVCCLCKERAGACIQCSVKTCKIAFHVTCGIAHNLDMKTILDDSDEEDGVKLKAFCPKHTKRRDRTSSDSELDSPTKDSMGTPKKDLTNEEVEGLRKDKLKQLEDHFYTLIDAKKVAEVLQLPLEAVETIVNFWKLKRKSLFDKPLLTPKTQEAELLEKQQEDSLMARMKMFVHLRQDLERVRNLCYMVSRREKMKRSYRRLRENVFMAQVKVLSQVNLSTREVNRVKKLYYDTSCYRPRVLLDYGMSSDEAPSTSQESSIQPFSREGTPLSSSSLTSEPEIRKSSRRRILSSKLRDVSPVFSDSTSQDGSFCASEELFVPGYDSDAKATTAVKRSIPVNGKLSLSRRSRMSRKILGSDSENPEADPVSGEIVSLKKETENGYVQIDVEGVSDKSGRICAEKVLPLSDTPDSPSQKPLPNTRLSLRSDHTHTTSPKTEPPLERTKVKVEKSDNSIGLAKTDSPRRRVKSRFSRTPLSGHRNVRKTRQTPSISPESVENKPTHINNRLRDITPSPGKHKQFGDQLPPISSVNDNVKKELKDILQQSQLVIDEKLREEVEERLLKSASPKRYMNGLHGRSPRRFNAVCDAKTTRSNQGLVNRPNSFNQALTPNKMSNSDKVFNEISPTYTTRTGVENKDWFGTNTSPRGSLSGYKIPKKSNRTPLPSPVEAKDPTDATSPLTAGVLETRGNIRRKIDLELSKTSEQDSKLRRSRDNSPDKVDRRLTRSHGHENIEEVLITGRSRAIDALQMWSSNTG